jgi:phosphatidylglycerophosphate synthase
VSAWLTPANALTLSRLLSAPLLAVALLADQHGAAGLLFALAVASDLADGPLARRRGEASALGGLLDHASDASFVTAGLGALALGGHVTPLLPALIAIAFVQYALDSRALSGRRLRASRLGRWNGIAYFVALGIPVVRDALGLTWPGPLLVHAVAWLLVLATLASIADRMLAALESRGARGQRS